VSIDPVRLDDHIIVREQYEAATGGADPGVLRSAETDPWLVECPEARVAATEFGDNSGGSIIRRVVDHDDLKRAIGYLGRQRLKSLREDTRAVACAQNHGRLDWGAMRGMVVAKIAMP
jgi:hypothetical protein